MQDFEEVYAAYYARVFKYVMSLCHDASLAEEITQECFFKAFKGIEGFKGDCQIGSWLCAIAKNCYFSQIRKESRRTKPPEEIPSDANIEAQFFDKENAQDIHR